MISVMRLSDGVEWSLHSLWLLGVIGGDRAVPAQRLAEFYGLPDAYLAKILKLLVKAGLLTSTSGPRGGFRLARAPDAITALDVVNAIEGRQTMFRCTEIRQRGPEPLGPTACRTPCGIAQVMLHAERAWRDQLAATTVADLIAHAPAASTARAKRWQRRGLEQRQAA
jgi:Rrf2 family protein